MSGLGERVGTLDSGWMKNRVIERAERQLVVVGGEQWVGPLEDPQEQGQLHMGLMAADRLHTGCLRLNHVPQRDILGF